MNMRWRNHLDRIGYGVKTTDVDAYLKAMKTRIKQLLREQVSDMHSMKTRLSLWIKWLKFEPTTDDVTYINNVSKNLMTDIIPGSDLEEVLDAMFTHVEQQVENPDR